MDGQGGLVRHTAAGCTRVGKVGECVDWLLVRCLCKRVWEHSVVCVGRSVVQCECVSERGVWCFHFSPHLLVGCIRCTL